MRIFSAFLAALLIVTSVPAAAVPAAEIAAAQQGLTASIPFDPPVAQELRFRSEKVVEEDGKSRMTWEVFSSRFDESEDGFTLTVTPISSGSDESNTFRKAIEEQLAELSRLPVVFHVTSDGLITGLVNEDVYWKAIFDAVEAAIQVAPPGGKALDDRTKIVFANYLKVMREMPEEGRLALLTAGIQPLIEFAATETTVGEPITTELEMDSIFGDKIKREVRIALHKIQEDVAHLTVRATIPREELEALAVTTVSRIAAGAPIATEKGKIQEGFAQLEHFSLDAVAEYEVSLVDGMLLRHHSTESVEARDKDGAKIKTTTISIVRTE